MLRAPVEGGGSVPAGGTLVVVPVVALVQARAYSASSPSPHLTLYSPSTSGMHCTLVSVPVVALVQVIQAEVRR